MTIEPITLKTFERDGPLSQVNLEFNWTILETIINAIIMAIGPGVMPVDIRLNGDGDALIFEMADGTLFGPLPMPARPLRIRGPWATALGYAVGDQVSEGGNSYVCVFAHVSDVFADDLAAGKWVLSAAKGEADPDISEAVEDLDDRVSALEVGGGGGGPSVQIVAFQKLGAVGTGTQLVAQFVAPYELTIPAAVKWAIGLFTQTGSGLKTVTVTLTEGGTTVGTLALSGSAKSIAGNIASDHTMQEGDVLIITTTSGDPGSADNVTVSIPIVPA